MCAMRMAEASDSSAAAANTPMAPVDGKRAAASSGPASTPPASRIPRAALAAVSSGGVAHNAGSSAEWIGRYSVNATVDTPASR